MSWSPRPEESKNPKQISLPFLKRDSKRIGEITLTAAASIRLRLPARSRTKATSNASHKGSCFPK